MTLTVQRPKEKRKNRNSEYNQIQNVYIFTFVCTASFLSFLPYILQMELYDEDPDTPYSGAVDSPKIDIVNAVNISCLSMLSLEIFLDSNTLYIPIKIAFPRFIMILGLLVTSLVVAFQPGSNSKNRLSFIVCSHYAKIYLTCAGISLGLLRDAAKRKSKERVPYAIAVVLLTSEMTIRQWGAYFDRSHEFLIAQNCVTLSTLIVGVYMSVRVVQHYLFRDHNRDNIGRHYYDYMSHFIICILIFGLNISNVSFGMQSWKNTTTNELTVYNFIFLFAAVLFFFTSSYIAQRHFVKAEVRIIQDILCYLI